MIVRCVLCERELDLPSAIDKGWVFRVRLDGWGCWPCVSDWEAAQKKSTNDTKE